MTLATHLLTIPERLYIEVHAPSRIEPPQRHTLRMGMAALPRLSSPLRPVVLFQDPIDHVGGGGPTPGHLQRTLWRHQPAMSRR
jgi:hypothetical protein